MQAFAVICTRKPVLLLGILVKTKFKESWDGYTVVTVCLFALFYFPEIAFKNKQAMYTCPACVSATCVCRCMQHATLSFARPPGIQAPSHEELQSYSRQVWWTTWTLTSQSSLSFTCFLWLIRVRCAFEIAFLELLFHSVPEGTVTVADWRVG